MVAPDLKSRIFGYEDSLRVCAKWCAGSDPVARALCEIYARRSAKLLFSFVCSLYPIEINTIDEAVPSEYRPTIKSVLPTVEVVRSCELEFSDAVKSHDWNRVMRVLKKMGVPGLCLPPERQLDQLEFVVGCVIGRPRLVPLVELATFVAEQCEYDRVKKYVEEAYTLNPGATELHDLLTISGIVALGSNDVTNAKRQLLESVRVCTKDGYPCIPNRLYGFNVSLAQKLLEYGQRDAVIDFLAQCQRIWSHQRGQINTWIEAIRSQQQPEFRTSEFLIAVNRPGVRIQALLLRASGLGNSNRLLEMGKDDDPVMETHEAIEEYRRQWRKAMRGKLDIGKN